MNNIKKEKAGKGYYQSGYGRGFKKRPIIWKINGGYYAKDAAAFPYQTDMNGFVMVNKMQTPDGEKFYEVGLISEHQKNHT